MASVDLILPVFNEAAQVPRIVPEIARWIQGREQTRAVLVDDGSTDGTADAIRAAIDGQGLPNIRLERSPTNRGKGAIVREAILSSKAELICFTDGDLAYSLDHVDLLLEALSEADVAIGSRELNDESKHSPRRRRRVSAALFNAAARRILGLPYRDTQAGLKGFRASAAVRLFGRARLDDFAFDAEVLYLARLERLRVAEIPACVSGLHAEVDSSVNLFRDPWTMLWSLLRIRWIHRSVAPHHPVTTA